jgi:dGTPase
VADDALRFTKEGRRDFRTPAQVDRDRILYSRHFQRLAEVTQVVSADRGYVFHNRLTHSLKVAQLARRIAEKFLIEQKSQVTQLGGLDPDAAEAAGLAHDIGHPPFGHIAETTLNLLTKKAGLRDGFNGNAQSFRIVTKLAMGDAVDQGTGAPVAQGLNLTRRTLDGILKYPWFHAQNPDKWGVYNTERTDFNWVRKNHSRGSQRRSLEAELMDWADDVTYAVHDLVDFYCAGQIPLDRLADQNDAAERDAFLNEVFLRRKKSPADKRTLQNAFRDVMQLFAAINRRYDGSVHQQRDLWQLVTVLISRYVSGIELARPANSAPLVVFEPSAKNEISMLKELTWHYVILRPELAVQQYGQKQAIETVWSALLKDAMKSRPTLFPLEYQEELYDSRGDAKLLKRTVCDYIASMSEAELLRVYRSLHGRV